MFMKIIKYIILIFSLHYYLYPADNNFYFDYAMFKIDSSAHKLEIYYAIPDTSFSQNYERGMYRSKMDFLAEVIVGDSVIASDAWNVKIVAANKYDSHRKHMYGQRVFNLPHGNFKFKTSVYKNFPDEKIFEKVINLNSINSRSEFSISDIQLADIITKNDPDSSYSKMFVKNNLYVKPNPKAEYKTPATVCLAYLEVYNAQKNTPDGYQINYTMLDALRREIQTIPGASVQD